MRILFVTSTLKRSGPTNQLYSLINHLREYDHDLSILTLSVEPEDSRIEDFRNLGIDIQTIGLSRLRGIMRGKKAVEKFIVDYGEFDIVHTQGIRADSILSKINGNFKWVVTSHNNPDIDYPMKFGMVKGNLMALKQKRILNKCENVISCSRTIQNELQKRGIESKAVQNGVELSEIDSFQPGDLSEYEKPIFVSVGSLIDRKNMRPIINAFNNYSQDNNGTLFIIGDGPDKDALKREANDRIIFTGNVNNVPSYLKSSDVFISASKAEGLPYTVLEALAADLPVILSDIPSHREIKQKCKGNCILFKNDEDGEELLNKLKDMKSKDLEGSRKVAENVFSAHSMASNYNKIYESIVVKS